SGIEVIPQQTGSVAIDAGGGADGNYQADTGFVGGQKGSLSSAIDTSLVTDPAPQAVYQTFRQGTAFLYTVSGLAPNTTQLVRLDFVEPFYTQTGQRIFNVYINGQQVLSNFDILAAAGAQDRAIAEYFPATARGDGTILIQFSGTGGR